METTTMYEISTQCSCFILDEETGEETESTVCFGYCSDDQMEDFQFVLTDWFVPGTFLIEGFPVLYGTVGGLFDAKNPPRIPLVNHSRTNRLDSSIQRGRRQVRWCSVPP